MSTRIPMYEGDSYIRPGLTRDEGSPAAPGRAEASIPTVLELDRIEREARRLRSEVVGGLMARFFGWFAGRRASANQRALERAIGRPTDAADLEHRLRAFERRGGVHAA